jgi:hypothetical protein
LAVAIGNAYTHPDTPQLYSAIVRIFLVYSAFETYCRIIGLNPSNETQVKPLQDAQSQSEASYTVMLDEEIDSKKSKGDSLIDGLFAK